MAAYLTAGTSDTESSPFSLSANESATLYIVPAAGPEVPADSRVDIQIQGANNTWVTFGQLNVTNRAQVLTAAGTFRVRRRACTAAIAVDKN